MNEIWLEKYRPKTFSDFIGQEKVISSIKSFIEKKDIPNMIFYGPPGTGKTSMVHILISEIFHKEDIRDRVLELNASDERGIKVIRNTVKMFASYSISADNKNIPIKIVFLDEADSLTLDTQFALRRIMEDYASTTRFILTCNYLNKIITPLISRCSVLNFFEFEISCLKTFCDDIIQKENLMVENIDNLIIDSDYNLRKIINSLQSGHYLQTKKEIDWEKVLDNEITDIYNDILSMIYDGFQADYLLTTFTNWIIKTYNLDNNIDFFIKLSEITSNISNRGTPIVNITYIIYHFKYLLLKNSLKKL